METEIARILIELMHKLHNSLLIALGLIQVAIFVGIVAVFLICCEEISKQIKKLEK